MSERRAVGVRTGPRRTTVSAHQARLDYAQASPGAYEAMIGLERYIRQSGIDRRLLHLVKMRASQINGCAYCLNLHSREALREGESARRLFQLDAWPESPDFTPRERAALAWTEAVTRVRETRVPDEVYRLARSVFPAKELVDLTLAVVAINGWNRLAISFRIPPEDPPPA
ncbi:MAG TPA: carboxymuconolactone decarboxylase family protein [Thermoplasmata archaeon]|nr:carboxymuconolactone decarboxylase family protein [Thermoplasmata archaeon]